MKGSRGLEKLKHVEAVLEVELWGVFAPGTHSNGIKACDTSVSIMAPLLLDIWSNILINWLRPHWCR